MKAFHTYNFFHQNNCLVINLTEWEKFNNNTRMKKKSNINEILDSESNHVYTSGYSKVYNFLFN